MAKSRAMSLPVMARVPPPLVPPVAGGGVVLPPLTPGVTGAVADNKIVSLGIPGLAMTSDDTTVAPSCSS
jgi:hypothetical protein